MPVPMDVDLYSEQPEILRLARVPLVKSWNPMWHYITAVRIFEHPDKDRSDALIPTEIEQRQIASFHQQYVSYWYGTAPGQFTGWYERLRAEREFDIDGSAAGRLLGKRPDGSWAYRIRTWGHGPRPMLDEPPMTLLEVMDRARHGKEKWEAWKKADPELFGPEVYAAAKDALAASSPEARHGQA